MIHYPFTFTHMHMPFQFDTGRASVRTVDLPDMQGGSMPGFINEAIDSASTTMKTLQKIRGKTWKKVAGAAAVVGAMAIPIGVAAANIVSNPSSHSTPRTQTAPKAVPNINDKPGIYIDGKNEVHMLPHGKEPWSPPPQTAQNALAPGELSEKAKEQITDTETAENRRERVLNTEIKRLIGLIPGKDGEDEGEQQRWNRLRKGYINTYPYHIFEIIMNEPLPVRGRSSVIMRELTEKIVKKTASAPGGKLLNEFPDAPNETEVLSLFMQSIPRWHNESFSRAAIDEFSQNYPRNFLEKANVLRGLYPQKELAHFVFQASQRCPKEAMENRHQYGSILDRGSTNGMYLYAQSLAPYYQKCPR